MTRSLLGVLAVAGIGLTAFCDKPKPQPTPSPSATVAPTPEPTPTPYRCPEVEQARVKIVCGDFSMWEDGRRWDCTPKYLGAPILPESDPHRAACDLEAVGGVAPEYILDGTIGTLRLVARAKNPFQFVLYGQGSARLVCLVGDGHDACSGRAVSQ